MEKKTVLYDCHVECGGKIVPFAGYLLPVQYASGVIAEHMAVRQNAGMFDVSHMGEFVLKGPDAAANVQMLVTNDCINMKDGQVKYAPMCNTEGGIVDDLLVYKFADDEYMLVVNAANKEKDLKWIKEHMFGNATFTDKSDEISQIALQGPKAFDILKKITGEENIPVKYYTFIPEAKIKDMTCLISYTGYTGEAGVEIYCDNSDAPRIWNMLLEAGKADGLIPCGLGARDTLRFEAGMPLYGHEMNDEITPFEADLGFAVKMKKDDFIGKAALEKKGDITRKRVGIKMIGKGIAREHFDVFVGDKNVGFTTSGTMCPYIGYAVAMALLDLEYTEVGTKVEVDIRGKKVEAEVVSLPFYKKA